MRIANGDPPPPKARLRRWEVDEINGHVLLTFRHRVRKAPGLTALTLRSYAGLFDSTAQEDVRIWEHRIYWMRPAASKADWSILAFRRWSKQFFDRDHDDAARGRSVEPPAAE